MRVLVFQYQTTGSSFHGTELELIESHLAASDEVEIVGCGSKRYGCDLNPKQSFLQCTSCKIQSRRGNSMLSQKVPMHDYVDLVPSEKFQQIEEFAERAVCPAAELRQLRYEDFDIGLGILSSIITLSRDPTPDAGLNRDRILMIAKAALAIYEGLSALFEQRDFDQVYLFNGRYATWRAVIRACEKYGIDYTVHEGGNSVNHYGLWPNSNPHNIGFRTKEINRLWDQNQGSREEDGARYFELLASGGNLDGSLVISNFTEKQKRETLPGDWNSEEQNVVIFCSSDDEVAAIGEEWDNPLYHGQLDGLQKIAHSTKHLPDGVRVYLRMHPNLLGVENEFVRKVVSLASNRFRIITPDSPISSYKLLNEADKIVTFGSTMGIEAVYWGKPSILLGASFYRELGGTYNPTCHDEAMKLIVMKLEPKDREPALRYGNHLLNFGIPYKTTDASRGVRNAIYKGCHLNGNLLHRSLLNLKLKLFGDRFSQLREEAKKRVGMGK